MEIYFATIEDAEKILELQKAAYLSEAELHDDYSIPPLTQTIDQLKDEFLIRAVLKVVDGNNLLASGQARFENGTCYIGRMAVWPDLQGCGIGSKLLYSLETLFPEASRIELFTGENSESNLAMYKKRGYKPFKTEKRGKTTVVFLEKLSRRS